MADLFGFTIEQARRITGLSVRQLRYWEKTGFFSPDFQNGEPARQTVRLYSFRNLVGLKTIAELRQAHDIPLQELRKVGAELSTHHETPWASLTLYVAGHRVYFDDPTSGAITDARSGEQTTFPIELKRIAHETQLAIEKLRERGPENIGKVAKTRNVVHNEPVVAGTRIPTTAIWNLHEAGYDTQAILGEYPHIHARDVQAAIRFESRIKKQKAS